MSIEVQLRHRIGDFSLNLDLVLPSQGVSVLFGPSGSGKTSLLRVLAGLERFDDAVVQVNGEVWQDNSQFVAPHQRQVGYVFQQPSLFSHLNVAANINYGRRRAKHSLDEQSKVVELLGLQNLLGRKPSTLSGGEQQRVAIARALATSPKLLLMDEPLASLDKERRDEVLPYLEEMTAKFKLPIIYVTHSIDEVARIGDYMVLLKAGSTIGSGSVQEVLTRIDLPLAKQDDAETLITGTVSKFDDQHQVNYISFSDGEFAVPGRRMKEGSQARIRIAARDVSLTIGRHVNTSILNVFPATVMALKQLGNAQMLVALNLDNEIILARVTRLSASRLNLKIDLKVYVQIKSVAVLL